MYQVPTRFQENSIAARMKIKPSKMRNISIVKGKQRFYINQEPILTMSKKKKIKNLGS